MGRSPTGGMRGSPHHPDPSGSQPRGCWRLRNGHRVGRAAAQHRLPHPRGACRATLPRLLAKTMKSGRKMSRTTRAGWGRRAAGTPTRAETSECLLSNWVKWDEGKWRKKTKPKTTAFKQLLFTVCTEPGGQSIPVQRPLRAGCDTDTHIQPRPKAARAPLARQRGAAGREPGWPGCCGAEVEHRPGESHSGAGGAEDQKAPVHGRWAAAGSGDRLPPGPGAPSPSMGLEGERAQPQVPLAEPKCACSSLGSAHSLGKLI